MKIIWKPAGGVAHIKGVQIVLQQPPALSFDFKRLEYDTQTGICQVNNKDFTLSADDLLILMNFFQSLAALFDIVVPAPGVDADGYYIGNVPANSQKAVPRPPPAAVGWRWNGVSWEEDVPLEAVRAQAKAWVDDAAGAARARYITVCPGQEATYLLKGAQALQYHQDPAIIPGAFLVAEAEATGMSLIDVAATIVQLSDLWANQLGPAIELHRRRAKMAISAATSYAQIQDALALGIAELQKI